MIPSEENVLASDNLCPITESATCKHSSSSATIHSNQISSSTGSNAECPPGNVIGRKEYGSYSSVSVDGSPSCKREKCGNNLHLTSIANNMSCTGMTILTQDDEQHRSKCTGDNISCITTVRYSNAPSFDCIVDEDKKDLVHRSASTTGSLCRSHDHKTEENYAPKLTVITNCKDNKASYTKSEVLSSDKKQTDPCPETEIRQGGDISSDEVLYMQAQLDVEGEHPNADSELYDVKVCDICGDVGREELLAICSRCADGAEHIYCMKIKLDKLPEDDWLCEECKSKETTIILKTDKSEPASEMSKVIVYNRKQFQKENTKAIVHETRGVVKRLVTPEIPYTRPASNLVDCLVTSKRASQAVGKSLETASGDKTTPESTLNNIDLDNVKPGDTSANTPHTFSYLKSSLGSNSFKVPSKDHSPRVFRSKKFGTESTSIGPKKGEPLRKITKVVPFKRECSDLSKIVSVGKKQSLLPSENKNLGGVKHMKVRDVLEQNRSASDRQSPLSITGNKMNMKAEHQYVSLENTFESKCFSIGKVSNDKPHTEVKKQPSSKYIGSNFSESSNSQRASVIPELQFIWRGGFEVMRSGGLPHLFDGIQGHLSNYASPEVSTVVTKFPCKVQLEEVPRMDLYPSQFQRANFKEDDIALYFFAKDTESYKDNYSKLLENMHTHDFALRGNIDGVELFIFPSNILPANCQCWNRLYFLWGVFRRRTKTSEVLSDSDTMLRGSTLFIDLNLPPPISNDDSNCRDGSSKANMLSQAALEEDPRKNSILAALSCSK